MKRNIFLLLVFIVLTNCSVETYIVKDILFEGDSNTNFIGNTERYINSSVNIAVKGSTTDGVVDRMCSHNIIAKKLVLMIGTNDLREGNNKFYYNYSKIINYYKNNGYKIYCVSILPQTLNTTFSTVSNSLIIETNENIKNLCIQKNVNFIDEWNDFFDKDNNSLKKEYDGDGLHLNNLGREKHISNIIKHIQ